MRINVPQCWIGNPGRALKCKICLIPLNYLGILIGTNSKRINRWNKVIEIVKSRLSKWKNKHLCLGGRIIWGERGIGDERKIN